MHRALLALATGLLCWSLLGPVAADDEDPEFGTHFAPHEPVYFSVGWNERTNARFQLSFRYRFINPGPEPEVWQDFLTSLYFAYTQTSLWDLESESAPFRDTAYRPSLFYESPLRRAENGRRAFRYRLGFEHESNGRDGEFSRSINVLFLRAAWTLGDPDGYHWTVEPKVYHYVGDLEENPDIADYRGHVDLLATFGKQDSWKLSTTLRKGTEKDYGSVQVDVSYPTYRLFRGRIHAYLHLQYFCGWGESILDYDRKLPSQVRLGLLVVR